MHMFRADRTPGRRGSPRLSLLLLLLLPVAGAGQERAVVSSEITVSSGEASLLLQFVDGGTPGHLPERATRSWWMGSLWETSSGETPWTPNGGRSWDGPWPWTTEP
jgi:hypothetical protein